MKTSHDQKLSIKTSRKQSFLGGRLPPLLVSCVIAQCMGGGGGGGDGGGGGGIYLQSYTRWQERGQREAITENLL